MSRYAAITLWLITAGTLPGLAVTDLSGTISGTITTDSTWKKVVYLSVVSGFDDMYKMSDKMIVAESPIDSLGNFYFDIAFLPPEDCLLRIHMVKKSNPPTTLIIGGREQNHFFFVGNRHSIITIKNLTGDGVFSSILISGSASTVTFNRINELAAYPELIDYESTILEKDFVEEIVNKRLRSLADTCDNLLLALYAIYKSDYKSDFETNKDFYTDFLKKWELHSSPYFSAFKKQLPVQRRKWEYVLFALLLIMIFTGLEIYLKYKKNRRLNMLSVQERKILTLLQKGASNQEISDECHIEISTVKSHVSSIFSKLKIKSRKEVIGMPSPSPSSNRGG